MTRSPRRLILCTALLLAGGCSDDAQTVIDTDGGFDSDRTDAVSDVDPFEICNNQRDDDGDGDIDCRDDDCETSFACRDRTEICDNGVDDNNDGLTDCADIQCRDIPACDAEGEDCDNFIDDDDDGFVDCEDTDCASVPACDVTCNNGALDDDEECDGDNLGSCDAETESCSGSCECELRCGNDEVDADEDCDGDQIGSCDALTEACTDACECELLCGNGAVDTSEDCDGDELGTCNAETETCSSSCTCVELGSCGDGSIDAPETCEPTDTDACTADQFCNGECVCQTDECPGGITPLTDPTETGTNRWAESFTLPDRVARYLSCGVGSGGEVVIEWDVPATGEYHFTTFTELTVTSAADTVLAVRRFCDNTTDEEQCNDDIDGETRASAFDLSLGVGETVFIVVGARTNVSNGREVELQWGLITEGAESDECDNPFVTCGDGLLCDDGLCEASVAPTLDELIVFQTRDTDELLIGFTATEPNRDLDSLVVDLLDGETVLLDDFGITLLDRNVMVGDTTTVGQVVLAGIDSLASTPTDVRAFLEDADGNTSGETTVAIGALGTGVSDDCLPPWFHTALTCDAGLVCNDNNSNCANASGDDPAITSATFVAYHPDMANGHCQSTPAAPNGVELSIQGDNDEDILGATVDLGSGPIDVDLEGLDDPDTFSVNPVVCVADLAPLDSVEATVTVVDTAGRASAGAMVTLPAP